MNVDEAIKAILSSHAVGGGAGGLVQALSKEEAWKRVIIATFIGTVSAVYLTPFFVWTLARYLAFDANVESFALDSVVAFCVGMVSISLSGVIEMVLSKITQMKVGK
jgi:hypothetical protein